MNLRLLALAVVGCASPVEDVDPPEDPGIVAPAVTFVAVDNGNNRLVLVDEITGGGWSASLPPGGRDVHRIADTLLVSTPTGYRTVALSDGLTVDEVDGFENVQSVAPFEGGLLVAETDGDEVRLTVVRPDATTHTILVPGYPEVRLVRPTPEGTYLLTTGAPWRVVELDAEGVELWSAPLPGKGHLAERVGDLTYVSTGDDLRVVALDLEGTIVQAWGGAADHPDLGLSWTSGFSRLRDDAVLVANWLGHAAWGTGPHLVIYGADDEVLWTYADHEAILQVTHVLPLATVDLPGLLEER
jgi:hypothetical protein